MNKIMLLLLIILFLYHEVPVLNAKNLSVQELIVIGVRFKNVTNSTDITFLRNRIFVEMNRYYQEVSFENIGVTGEIFSHWVDIPNNMSYYGNYSNNNHSLGARKLIEDAISIVDNEMNFSNYDSIMIVHVGGDEARSRNETDIWSWGWWDGLGLSTNDGKIFQQGAAVSESDPLGVFCHEFGHILGLPDLYNYNISSTDSFVGPWGLMGSGSWNNNGTHPSHPIAWSKIKMGWIGISQISIVENRSTIARIWPLEQPTIGTMVIRIPTNSSSIYYLVEARKHSLYDRYLPNEGVIITLINETRVSGQGIVRVVNARNSSTSLLDAAFSTQLDREAVFVDKKNDLGVVVLDETNGSFGIHITSYSDGSIAKEAHGAIRSADIQIEAIKNTSNTFIPILEIDLSKAFKLFQLAKSYFERTDYIQSIGAANQAISEARASELEFRSKETVAYCLCLAAAIILAAFLAKYVVRREV